MNHEVEEITNGARLLAADRSVCRAEKLFEQMKTNLLQVTSAIFDSAIAGYERNNGNNENK